jgi:hypothetical protein
MAVPKPLVNLLLKSCLPVRHSRVSDPGRDSTCELVTLEDQTSFRFGWDIR